MIMFTLSRVFLDTKCQYLLLYQLRSIEIVLRMETTKNARTMKFVRKKQTSLFGNIVHFNYLHTYNIDLHKMANPFYSNFLFI
jgi:hypothetical protein